jgi:hypothetical protein
MTGMLFFYRYRAGTGAPIMGLVSRTGDVARYPRKSVLAVRRAISRIDQVSNASIRRTAPSRVRSFAGRKLDIIEPSRIASQPVPLAAFTT